MPWAPPQPELNNYSQKQGVERAGSNNGPDCGRGVCTFKEWLGPEELAWVCNQEDNCWGFQFAKFQGHGGWLFNKANLRPETSNTKYDIYEKKSTTWRKAADPDTSVEGVLPKDETQSKINGYGWSTNNDYSIGLGLVYCRETGYPKCNQMNSYRIPLGWKWMIGNDNIANNAVEGYWNRDNMGWDGQFYTLDYPNDHGVKDRDDSVLAQNIGFDVKANWNSMVSKGVHPEDALKIKHNWCKTSITNLNDANCTNYYATPEAAAAGYRYDTDMFELCKADPAWFNKASCRTAFNNAVKGTNESLRQQAKDKVTAYCDTNDGATQVDGLCGCYNVMKYGRACLGDKAALPGCRELKSTIGDLPPGAQASFADKFCASDVCVTQALGNAALLPDYTQGKQCPSIAMCVQDFRNASLTNSPVKAECRNTLNITGLPGPAAAAVPPTPPPSGAAAGSTGGTAAGSTGGTAAGSTGGMAAAPAVVDGSAGVASATSASPPAISKGAIIGISIGGFLFIIMILVFLYFMFRKKSNAAAA